MGQAMLRRLLGLSVESRSSRKRKEGKARQKNQQMQVKFAKVRCRRRQDNQRKGRLLDKVV